MSEFEFRTAVDALIEAIEEMLAESEEVASEA